MPRIVLPASRKTARSGELRMEPIFDPSGPTCLLCRPDRLEPLHMNPPPTGSRRTLLSLCLLVLAGLSLTGTAAAQDDASKDPVVQCPTCSNQGKRDCKSHPKAELALERQGLSFCSEVAGCKACGGTTWVDCTICVNKAVEDAEAARRSKIKDWADKRREKVDSFIKHPCLHGSSEHVDLVFELKPMTVGKVKFSTHELMHLYLIRIEDQRGLFLETLE